MKAPAKPVWAIIALERYVEELESYVRELQVELARAEMIKANVKQEDV